MIFLVSFSMSGIWDLLQFKTSDGDLVEFISACFRHCPAERASQLGGIILFFFGFDFFQPRCVIR